MMHTSLIWRAVRCEANSEIRELLLNQTNSREWTGWKIKVDFQASESHGTGI
jgi:hypothetical protein